MVFKRVLHPVGQGAFFSEHFYEDSGINYFNVIYDCGEKRTTKHLDPEIENTFHVVDDNPVIIDLMFLSHLDEDHIKGLDHLIKIGSLTSKSVIVLPFNFPLVIKMLLQDKKTIMRSLISDDIAGILQRLFDTEAKILGADTQDGDNIIHDSLDLEEGLGGIKKYGAIRSFQPLKYKNKWIYIPFNTILDDDRYSKFNQALSDKNIDKKRLTDIEYVKDKLDVLAEIYRKLPGVFNNITAINVNSLNVLSCSSENIRFNDVWMNYYDNMRLRWYRPWYNGLLFDMIYESRCSCLYTGDCVLESHFKRCLDLLIGRVVPYIGMLQVPHHGREGNYNRDIACMGEIMSGFTNFNTTHIDSKFVKQIVHDYSFNKRAFFQITEHFHSRLEVYAFFPDAGF